MENSYDKEEDILNIQIQDKEYWKSIELPNGIVIDVSKDGSINKIGELYDKGLRDIDSWTYNEEKNKMVKIKNAEIIKQGKRGDYCMI